MTRPHLSDIYRGYIACLNGQDWTGLERFVKDDVRYNHQQIGLTGYREHLVEDFARIPDLRFDVELLITDPSFVASRLRFDCSPKGEFLGLAVNGRRVSFSENGFYRFRDDRIDAVWSVIDKTAIEAQL